MKTELGSLMAAWVILATTVFSISVNATRVNAADGYDGTQYPYSTLVTETGDYFVVIEVASTFTAETDLCENTTSFWCAGPQQGGNFTDSVLWLYDAAGLQLAANDDDPRTNGQSYQSYISVQLEAGVYRLRAGRFNCHDGSCFWPEDPFPVGGHYQLLTTAALLRDPNPPVVNPSSIPSVLPTPELTPDPSAEPTPTPEPSIEPTPTPEPTFEPTPTPAPETPSPSPSVAPSPTPEPSVTPPPTPEPTPEPTQTPPPTPEPTPTPTEPPPTVAPTQEPTNEPPPNPTATPEPTPEGTVEPSIPASPPPSPDPTAVPPPEPTQPPLQNLEEAAEFIADAIGGTAEAVAEVIGEAAAAVAESVGEAISTVANLGNEITEEEREDARTIVGPAVIMTTIAQAAVAASSRQSGNNSNNGGGGGAGGGGGKNKTPRNRSSQSSISERIRNRRTNK